MTILQEDQKMTKKQPLPVYLDEYEREVLEKLANKWGVSLSSAIKRLLRETSSVED